MSCTVVPTATRSLFRNTSQHLGYVCPVSVLTLQTRTETTTVSVQVPKHTKKCTVNTARVMAETFSQETVVVL